MELRFAPKTVNYLTELFREDRTQEETLEIIVPDSYPDAERVLCGNAVAVTRSKECRQSSVVVSGGIRANVLYMAEGEQMPRCIEAYLPFTVKAESPNLQEDVQVIWNVRVRSVDARALNSRKLMLRVNLCWSMTAYGDCQQELCTLEEPPVTLQVLEKTYPMLLPVETAERSFQMTEELSLPAGRPLVGTVYAFEPRLEVTEQRLAGNKAVFKGVAHLHVLYGTEEEKLTVYDTEIPFSQYCELRDVYEDEELQLQVGMTGCELDRTLQQDGEGLLATVHVLAQCVVMQKKDLQFVEDAYCTEGELSPQWSTYQFPSRLDRQQFSRTVRESKNADVADVVDVWAWQDHSQTQRADGGMELILPAMITVLYRDSNGMLQTMAFRSEQKEMLPMADGVGCRTKWEIDGSITAIPSGTGVELRYPVSFEADSYADGAFSTLSGGEIRESEKKEDRRPAVIARKSQGGESLWDIAKVHKTTTEKIRAANGMDTDTTENGILLIPT